MSGIAGALGTRPFSAAEAMALDRALAHRGPDGSGHWRDPHAPGAELVHRRLAVQDLSPNAAQPMASACGRYLLVFNGEIYNQQLLRLQLQAKGHRFHSSGDTEVLLALLIQHGLAALQQLRGMFAFCLWDRRLRQAVLARDPFGIKPLYLWSAPDGGLLFASELRALLATGRVPRVLDPAALSGFLLAGCVPEPATLIRDVQSLPAGHCALWSADGLQIQPYWTPSYQPGLRLPASEQIVHARRAIQQSITAHQLSDVPLGLFLSGGLDSSALLAMAPSGLHTISLGFREAPFNEAPRAAALARHFQAHHQEVEFTAAEAAAMLPAFLAAVDQPSVDGFNTYAVCGVAARQGLKVMLSGLGGDELFGGYPSFHRIPQLLRIHGRLGPARTLLAARLRQQPSGRCQRLAAFLAGPATLEAAHGCLRGLFAPAEVRRLFIHWGYSAELLTQLGPWDPAHDLHDGQPADQIAWLETHRYMGSQLLRDSDVFSMAHGLELRLPLVDAALFRQLSAIPSGQRLAPGKRLLAEAVWELRDRLPQAPKQGFSFPFQVWFDQPASPLRPGSDLHPLPPLPAGLDISAWARRWGLMVLHHWLQHHLQLELAG